MVLISCTKFNLEYQNIEILLPNTISNIKLLNTNYQIFKIRFGNSIFDILYPGPSGRQVRPH